MDGSSFMGQFGHRNLVPMTHQDDTILSADEKTEYFNLIRDSSLALVAAIQAGDTGPVFKQIEGLLDSFIPGVTIPFSMFIETGVWEALLVALPGTVENTRLFDELAWLMARISFFTEIEPTWNRENLTMYRSVYALFAPAVEAGCLHIVDLCANLMTHAYYESPCFWEKASKTLHLLAVGGEVLHPFLLCLRNSSSSWNICRDEEITAHFMNFWGALIEMLPHYAESDHVALIHLIATMGGTVLRHRIPGLVTPEILEMLCTFTSIDNTDVVEEIYRFLYFCLVPDPLDRIQTIQARYLFPLLPTILEHSLMSEEKFECMQFQAIQLLRMICEFEPVCVVETGLLSMIIEGRFNMCSYRIMMQSVWIVSDFMHNIPLDLVEQFAETIGQPASAIVVTLAKYMMEKVDDPTNAFLALRSLTGMKVKFLRFRLDEDFMQIEGETDMEGFLDQCAEHQIDAIDELVEVYNGLALSSTDLAELQDIMTEADRRATALEEEVKREKTVMKIRFTFGGK